MKNKKDCHCKDFPKTIGNVVVDSPCLHQPVQSKAELKIISEVNKEECKCYNKNFDMNNPCLNCANGDHDKHCKPEQQACICTHSKENHFSWGECSRICDCRKFQEAEACETCNYSQGYCSHNDCACLRDHKQQSKSISERLVHRDVDRLNDNINKIKELGKEVKDQQAEEVQDKLQDGVQESWEDRFDKLDESLMNEVGGITMIKIYDFIKIELKLARQETLEEVERMVEENEPLNLNDPNWFKYGKERCNLLKTKLKIKLKQMKEKL